MASRRVYSGRAVGLRVDEVRLVPGDRAASREVVEHPGAVALVPLTPEGRVILVRQYRYAVGEELLEIPAGTLEPGEEPAAAARRELREETGRTATDLELLASLYVSPGYSSELMHVFLARLDRAPAAPAPEEDERLAPVSLPFEEALRLGREGRIRDAKTVAGLELAAARLGPAAAVPGPAVTRPGPARPRCRPS